MRQAFLTKYVKRILSLGFTIPDETLRFDEETEMWIYQDPDWNKLKKIARNEGPLSQERLKLRELSYTNNQWVREALAPKVI